MTAIYRAAMLSSICSTLPALAYAQEVSQGKIETVVITATKRAEAMQNVPQSVSVMSEKNLKDVGAQDFAGLLGSMAGVELKQEQAGQGGVAIRGISEMNMDHLNGGTGSATGMYLDEMPLTAAGRFPGLSTFDMQRVEVLKGPQGTLFGEGSLAGTVRFIANKPKFNRYEAALDSTYSRTEGGASNHTLNVMGNVPLADDVAALRISAYQKQDGGFLDARITDGKTLYSILKDANGQTSHGSRLGLRLAPNSDLTLTGTYLHYAADAGTRNRGSDPSIGSFSFAEFSKDKLDAFNLTAEYSTAFADLVANASHTERHIFTNQDRGEAIASVNAAVKSLYPLATRVLNIPWASAVTGVNTAHDMTARANTLELRAVSNDGGALKWTAGVFYKKTETGFNDDGGGSPFIPASSWAAVTTAASKGKASVTSSLHTDSYSTIKQTALFGEVSDDINERLQVLLGGRLFRESRTAVTSWDSAFAYFSGGSAKGGDQSGKTDSLFNPKLTASYKIAPNMLGYVTSSQGFRSGGQNDYRVYIPGSPVDFKSEKLVNQELGLKTLLLDKSLVLNLSAFYMNWKDLQQLIAKGSAGIGSAIGNVGDAHSTGLEVESKWVAAAGLELSASASVMNAVLDNAVVLPAGAGGLTVPEGTRIPGTSKRSFSLGASYRHAIAEGLQGFAGARFSGRSNFTSDLPTYQLTTAGSAVLDLRAGIEAKKWQLYVFVDNAGNKSVALREDAGTPDILTGQRAYFWGRPQTIGINFRAAL